MKVLALSTYPVRVPVHGGQRRVHALGELYRRLGAQFETASVYTPHYKKSDVLPLDVPLGFGDRDLEGVPFVDDLQAGAFAARTPAGYSHFLRVIETYRPDVITVEQPFMAGLVARLRSEGRIPGVKVIYSSQNWEPPLKAAMLTQAGWPIADVDLIRRRTEDAEMTALQVADVVLAVSAGDAAAYRQIDSEKPVFIAPNGVAAPRRGAENPSLTGLFEGRPIALFVGSAYPPNIDGFNRLLSDDGFFFVPPHKYFAICGGVCDPIFASPSYHKFVNANSERVQFYPNISDDDLDVLKSNAHVFLLPILFGGGSNLKTAEALVSGKWVVTTTLAMRGFERFLNAPGVVVADTPAQFRKAVMRTLKEAPLRLSEAQQADRMELVWERALRATGAEEGLRRFLAEARADSRPPSAQADATAR